MAKQPVMALHYSPRNRNTIHVAHPHRFIEFQRITTILEPLPRSVCWGKNPDFPLADRLSVIQLFDNTRFLVLKVSSVASFLFRFTLLAPLSGGFEINAHSFDNLASASAASSLAASFASIISISIDSSFDESIRSKTRANALQSVACRAIRSRSVNTLSPHLPFSYFAPFPQQSISNATIMFQVVVVQYIVINPTHTAVVTGVCTAH